MHVNVKIYIRFQILLVWTFTEYYINIIGGAERYSGPPRNNFGGAAAPPLPTPLPYLMARSSYFDFFLKIGQMVICPVRRTYNHV